MTDDSYQKDETLYLVSYTIIEYYLVSYTIIEYSGILFVKYLALCREEIKKIGCQSYNPIIKMGFPWLIFFYSIHRTIFNSHQRVSVEYYSLFDMLSKGVLTTFGERGI